MTRADLELAKLALPLWEPKVGDLVWVLIYPPKVFSGDNRLWEYERGSVLHVVQGTHSYSTHVRTFTDLVIECELGGDCMRSLDSGAVLPRAV